MNTFKTCITWGLIACLTLTLAGCGSKPKHDSAPKKKLNPARIKNAKPKDEPYSKYGNPPTYKVMGKTYNVWKTHIGYKEKGIASWYGTKFHKQLTSTREPYDMYAMTAAHKSLPIPSYAKVTNLDNHKSIIVRVNDRGPFADGRIIDLSYAAATKLDMLKTGTARVKVEAIDARKGLFKRRPKNDKRVPKEEDVVDEIYLQVAAFGERGNADKLANDIKSKSGQAASVSRVKNLYRVHVGPFKTEGDAHAFRDVLAEYNLGHAFIVR